MTTAANYPRIVPAGDEAAVVEFGDVIDNALNDSVYALAAAVEDARIPGVMELVPSYRSLLVQYDVEELDFGTVSAELMRLLESMPRQAAASPHQPQLIEIPVAYGGDFGPDLGTVAEHAGVPADEVVKIHSGAAYRVFMLGFAPGFPYLGGMDSRIACPRLKTPRVRVPAGSVGIAEAQTGVYPNESPGGWQLIGRTAVRLFDPAADPPAVALPGSFVRFVPVDPAEFETISQQVAAGSYRVAMRPADD